jgi:hypothetical protein
MNRHTLTTRRGASLAPLAFSMLLLLLAAASAHARTGRSTVRGAVRDQQGNAVAVATVMLADAERNFTRTQTTGDEGTYTFTAVPPGAYRVGVEAAGFKKALVGRVSALVDTPVDVDVSLEVGSVSETITISSGTDAPLNTTDASLGNTFERQRITELPLNANNVVGLLSLQPGVTRGGYVNGGRADQANVTLDGVDVNEQQRGLDVVTDEAFASVLRSTRDSLIRSRSSSAARPTTRPATTGRTGTTSRRRSPSRGRPTSATTSSGARSAAPAARSCAAASA